MITYHEGDLFKHLDKWEAERSATENVITIVPHIVNNIGVFGAGFVVPLGKRYPIVREEYLNVSARLLGTTQSVVVSPNVVVVNMVAQNSVKPKTIDGVLIPPIRYKALEDCMQDVYSLISLYESEGKRVQIFAPLFGSGLAGGDWSKIEQMIKKYWNRIPVRIYYIPNNMPPGWTPPSEHNEPEIIINGSNLTPAQAMAVRVAITSYHSEMADPNALFDDDHGHRMTKAYRQRLGEVLKLIIPPGDDSWLKQTTPEKK